MAQQQLGTSDEDPRRSRSEARVAVRLTGDLDLATAPLVTQLLRDALTSARVVLLDLRGLVFMDVFGMHVVVDASRLARSEGRRLEVIRGPAQVDAVFTLTRTDELLDLADLGDPPAQPADLQDVGPTTLARFRRSVHDEVAARTERRPATHLEAVAPLPEPSVAPLDAHAHQR